MFNSSPGKWHRVHALLPPIVLAASLAAHLVVSGYTLFPRDEGYHADVAERLLQSEIPYRDVYIDYPPTLYYLYAGLFKIFGIKLSVLRTFSALARWTVGLLAYLIARRALAPGPAATAPVVCAAFTLRPSHFHVMPAPGWAAVVPVMFCAVFVERYLASQPGRPALWAGFWAGVACTIRPHAGLACLAALPMILAMGPGSSNRESSRRVRTALCVASILLVMPLLAVNRDPSVLLGIYAPILVAAVVIGLRGWSAPREHVPPVVETSVGVAIPLLICVGVVTATGGLPYWWEDLHRLKREAETSLAMLPVPNFALMVTVILGGSVALLARCVRGIRASTWTALAVGATGLWLGSQALGGGADAWLEAAPTQLMALPWLLAIPAIVRSHKPDVPLQGIAVMALFATASMAPRYDFWRSLYSSGLSATLLTVYAWRHVGAPTLSARAFLPSIICLVTLSGASLLSCVRDPSRTWVTVFPPRIDVRIPREYLPRLLLWWPEIEARTKAGESVVVLPESTLAHFALKRRNPIRYSVFFPGVTSSDKSQDEIVVAIETDKTRLVVQLPDTSWPFEKYHPRVAAYLHERYRIVREVMLPYGRQPVRFWWRRSGG